MYKIKDLQFEDRPYFAGGQIFKSKREACEQIISYHEIDNDMTHERALLETGQIDECWQELSYFEWELEKIN